MTSAWQPMNAAAHNDADRRRAADGILTPTWRVVVAGTLGMLSMSSFEGCSVSTDPALGAHGVPTILRQRSDL
jgi:hypothetical protein